MASARWTRNLRSALAPRLVQAATGRRAFFPSVAARSDSLSVHRDTPNNNRDTLWDFTPENYTEIEKQLKKYPPNYKRSAVMPLLHIAQKQCEHMPEFGSTGWVPLAAMDKIAKILDMPPMRVYEVATFYTMYQRTPIGVHNLQVCTTSPCMVCGAYDVLNGLKDHLNINVGETTADGKFHLMEAECLGACCNAPMMQIAGPLTNDGYYEDLTPESAINIVEMLRRGEAPEKGPCGSHSAIGRHGSIGPQGKTALLSEPNGPYCRDLD